MTYVYYEMITIISLVNIHHLTWLQKMFLFSCDENFKDLFFSNFKIHPITVLSINTMIMVYITSIEFIYFITGSLYLLTTFIQFPQM